MIYLAPHLALPVLIWILQALVGMGLATHAIWDANQEIRARKHSGLNGPLTRTARILRRSPEAKLSLHLILLLFGVLNVLGPEHRNWSTTVVIEMWAFVVLQSNVIWIQILNTRDRQLVRKETRDLAEKARTTTQETHDT